MKSGIMSILIGWLVLVIAGKVMPVLVVVLLVVVVVRVVLGGIFPSRDDKSGYVDASIRNKESLTALRDDKRTTEALRQEQIKLKNEEQRLKNALLREKLNN